LFAKKHGILLDSNIHYTTKTAMLTNFDGDVFTRFTECIIVYSRTEIGFELKCGITLKERLVK
jgi:site-specific DNA recombinase